MKKSLYFTTAILLILLMHYSYTNHEKYYPSIADFAKNPEKYDNVFTEQQARISNITADSFFVRAGDVYIKVIYEGVREPKYGPLTFAGYYKKEGYIEAMELRYNDYNDLKYVFSLAGLFIFLFIFFKEWRITPRGFENG